jgi:hypothetical protein
VREGRGQKELSGAGGDSSTKDKGQNSSTTEFLPYRLLTSVCRTEDKFFLTKLGLFGEDINRAAIA